MVGVRRRQAQPGEDVRDVLFDGPLGDDQGLGDSGVGAALGAAFPYATEASSPMTLSRAKAPGPGTGQPVGDQVAVDATNWAASMPRWACGRASRVMSRNGKRVTVIGKQPRGAATSTTDDRSSGTSGRVQQGPGLWRTELQQHDLSVPGREVV